jgi:outer membrane protein insertion porin family
MQIRRIFGFLSFCFLAVFALSFHTVSAYAQISSNAPAPPPPPKFTILGISVSGNVSGNAETIISQSGLYKSEKITLPSEETRRGITQLWSESIYADVQIVVDRVVPQTDGTTGIFLTIHVKEFPRLSKVTITGNKQLKTPDIEKALGTRQYQFVRPWESEDAKRRIKALYEKEGYHFATIEIQTQPAKIDSTNHDSSSVEMVVTVDEGAEVTVRHINFDGNKLVTSDDLRSSFDDTQEKRWWKIFTGGSFDEKKYVEDKKKLITFYRSKGFRDATIISDSVWVTNKVDLNILVHVYEGPMYRVRNIAVVGNDVFSEDVIRLHLGFKKGDIYNIEKFNLNMSGPTPEFNDVGSLYYDRGYVASISKDEVVVPGDSVDITLHIDEGKAHYFRYVDIAGNTKTKDYVIRRELYTRPGDAFSRAAIIRSMRQISQLNYFNQEKLSPDVKMDRESPDVDVTYNVEEKSSDTFNASIGYGGSLGLTGSIGVSFNNFDLADPLHGGAGQVMSVTAEIGQNTYRNISINFSEPWLWQQPTSLGFSIYSIHYAYQYTVDRVGASLTIGRRLRWPDDFFRIDWTLIGQQNNITDGGGIYTAGNHAETSIQQTISRISTDNPVFPTTGSEFTLIDRIGYLPIASISPNEPANYFKNGLTIKFYTPLLAIGGQNKLVLTTSADVGQLGGLGHHPFVPPTERFTMGGSGLATGYYTVPLRGYDDAAIGINQLSGSSIVEGGLAYERFLAELRFEISLEPIPFYILGFGEAGNVWTDFSHADPFDLKRSLGVGARVQVPAVGMIGIDFGYGFDSVHPFGPTSGWRTHFQFGRGF